MNKKRMISVTGIAVVLATVFFACKEEAAVSGVKLDKTALTLTLEETAVLKATVEPENATVQTVTWSAEPAGVVTLKADGNSCTVTAVKTGTATVTVTTADGGKTAWCAVTVSPLDFEYDETTNTYTVYTAKGLYAWAEAANTDLGTNCVLAADIVLEKPAEGESNWQPVGPQDLNNGYNGTFDGRGHTIRNVTVNNPWSNFQGFFATIRYGVVEDAVLEDLSVTDGYDCVGGIAGRSSMSVVSGCYVKGSVRGMNFNVGGIVGDCFRSKIDGCCFDGSVQGTKYVGGITGWVDGASVKACRVKGSINGTDTVGGIAGGLVAQNAECSAECIGCCADVQIPQEAVYRGGVLGMTGIGTYHLDSCYWSGSPDSAGVISFVTCNFEKVPDKINWTQATAKMNEALGADFGWKFVCTDNSFPQPVRQ